LTIAGIDRKKDRLDEFRRRAPTAWRKLEHRCDIELTYTSNAIEGNTLTLDETRMVIERNFTSAGKPLRDYLEALDHHNALRRARELALQGEACKESDIRCLHGMLMKRSGADLGARCRYADAPRYIKSEDGDHYFPPVEDIPALMREFAAWLRDAPPLPETAFAAHLKLVDIHPFNDGNGRTARLLMNLILIRSGYPPVAIRPADHGHYIAALRRSQSGSGSEAFYTLLRDRLEATLDEYLRAFE
jgi:Fic family protein